MFVVEVIPLDTGAGVDRLSYFSSVDYPRGAIVAVPIRSRSTDAIVVSSAPVSSLKTALRAATFTLRKLPPEAVRGKVADSLLAVVDSIVGTHALSHGDVLSALLPARREYVATKIVEVLHDAPPLPPRESRTSIIMGTEAERYDEYRRIARETFASGGSTLFVAPTMQSIERAAEELSVGIGGHVVVFRGDMKAADHRRAVTLLKGEHPLLIIATPAYAHVERDDITTTIIEGARGKAYHGITRPYLDHKTAITLHARIRGADIVLGDLVLPAEDVERFRSRTYDYVAHGEFPKRLHLTSTLTTLHQKKDPDGTVPFTLFSPELGDALRSALKKKKRVFLLSARRGLAPVVACADCGHIFRDPESGAPLSLLNVSEGGSAKRYLVSSTSGHRELMRDVCPTCNSWRLRERGIGIQHIESELRKLFPDAPLTVLDHQSAPSHKKALALAQSFYEHDDGGILLGTAIAIPYLTRPVLHSAVVSMDSLLSLPSWRQQEEAFATLLALRERTTDTVFAQTRHRPDDRILALAARAELGSFYDEELEVRRTFGYPPYSAFILLTYKGSREAIAATEKMLEDRFLRYGISLYGMPPEDTAHVLRRGLLRFPREAWPDPDVVEALRALPPSIKIEFDPERIV